MQIEHQKNTPYYLSFPMLDSTSPESFAAGLTVADAAYYKDGAGAWTSLAITDVVSEIGSTGVYELDLTAAELNHDKVMIKFTAAGAADTAYVFDMRTKLAEDLNDVSSADVNAQCDLAISDAALATAANLAVVDGNVDAILVDTGTTLPGTLTTIEGKIDIIDATADAILVDTGTTLPGTLSTIEGKIDTIDTVVDAILADTGTDIPATLATLATAAALSSVASEVSAILADTGTDGVELSAATCNKVADHLLRRTLANARASADGDTLNFRTLLGAASKLVNRVAISGGNLLIYEETDTTAFGTQALTTDAAADPITEVDTA